MIENQQQALASPTRRQRRPKKRALFCPAHPDQQIQGNGKKYYLHLLQPEQLVMRGIPAKKARLIINAFPVFVLSHEWLESLFCPKYGHSHWCYVIKHDRMQHTVQWAPREIWEQVAHVEPSAMNGLRKRSQLMVDKLFAVPIGDIGRSIGCLETTVMGELELALKDWLALH